MPISPYMFDLRPLVGPRLLLVPSVAAIIHDEEGRVLLLRQSDGGRWSLPAGAIDPGEQPREALAREVREETGLAMSTCALLEVLSGAEYRVTYPNGDEVELTVCVFSCEAEGELQAVDGEAMQFEWVEPEQVRERLDLPYPFELFLPTR